MLLSMRSEGLWQWLRREVEVWGMAGWQIVSIVLSQSSPPATITLFTRGKSTSSIGWNRAFGAVASVTDSLRRLFSLWHLSAKKWLIKLSIIVNVKATSLLLTTAIKMERQRRRPKGGLGERNGELAPRNAHPSRRTNERSFQALIFG